MKNEKYMRIAIDEALKGIGYTNPNPIVGAVIVKDDEIISKDYHHNYGEFHAERNAILKCNDLEKLKGAKMYVTLEPCCHYGKTPPCTEIIINSGIKEVYIGSKDPNPLVAGKGVEILRSNGIKVFEGILEGECNEINKVFFHFIEKRIPYVVMKYAMTADGKIATSIGESKWITGEEARSNVHNSRHKYSGIMVGVNTVIKDNPMLTCRIENGINPIRIICDTNLRTPLKSNIVKTAKEIRTIIATASDDKEIIDKYKNEGCEILRISKKGKSLDLRELIIKLGELNIDSILLEGGSELNYSALSEGIVNKVEAYIAPKIFGGAKAKSPVGGVGILKPEDSFLLSKPKIRQIGEDILIEWEVIS